MPRNVQERLFVLLGETTSWAGWDFVSFELVCDFGPCENELGSAFVCRSQKLLEVREILRAVENPEELIAGGTSAGSLSK